MSSAAGPTVSKPAEIPRIGPDRRRDLLTVLVIGALLAGQFLLGILTARELSVTHDEYWHLPVGILNLRTWRFDYEPLNPPLTRLIAGAATSLMEPGCYRGPAQLSADPTTYGLDYLRQMRDRHQPSYVWGRMGNLAFALATGILLALWSWQWWGRMVAVVTVLLWCTEPTVLAHASLVTPDAGLVCLALAFWYAVGCYFRQPNVWRAVVCGTLAGLVQLTKFTAIILVPLLLLSWLVWYVWRGRLQPSEPRATSNPPQDTAAGVASRQPAAGQIWHPVLMLTLCLMVLNQGYGFEGTFSTLRQVQPKSATVLRMLQQVPWLTRVPLPFPKAYLVGLDAQKHVMESQHPVYLDGVWSVSGFRFYFWWALWYKLPHVWQVLGLLAMVRLVWDGHHGWLSRRIAFLAVPLLILLGTASLSGMQLGVRYVLPIYPFLCLICGSVFAVDAGRSVRRWQTRLLIALVIVAPLSLRFHPQHLAYFNELAGGPTGGAEHLLDSNLDWGQDLLELKTYIERHGDRHWGIAYFGSLPPGELGLRYTIPPGHGPAPGWYAVSVNYAYGRPHVAFDESGQPRAVGVGEFGYFRAFTPVRRIGASILIYQIRPTDLLRWQAR